MFTCLIKRLMKSIPPIFSLTYGSCCRFIRFAIWHLLPSDLALLLMDHRQQAGLAHQLFGVEALGAAQICLNELLSAPRLDVLLKSCLLCMEAL